MVTFLIDTCFLLSISTDKSQFLPLASDPIFPFFISRSINVVSSISFFILLCESSHWSSPFLLFGILCRLLMPALPLLLLWSRLKRNLKHQVFYCQIQSTQSLCGENQWAFQCRSVTSRSQAIKPDSICLSICRHHVSVQPPNSLPSLCSHPYVVIPTIPSLSFLPL